MANSGGIELFFLVVAILTGVLTLPVSLWMWTRRHKQPLRARKPWTVLMTILAYAVVCILACLQNALGSRFLCLIYWLAYSGANAVALSGLIIRGVLLVVAFNQTQEALTFRKKKGTAQKEIEHHERWWINNRNRFSQQWLTVFVLVAVILLLLPFMIYFAVNPEAAFTNAEPQYSVDQDPQTENCMNFLYPFSVVDLPFGFFLVIATVEVSKRIKTSFESLKIKEELLNIGKTLVVVGAGVTTIVAVHSLARRSENQKLKDVVDTGTRILYVLIRHVFPFYALMYFTVIQSTCNTYLWETQESLKQAEEQKEIAALTPDRPTLEWMRWELLALLQTEEGFELFKDYLCKEFSVENLLFWEAVRDYRVFASPGPVPQDDVFNFTPPELDPEDGSIFIRRGEDESERSGDSPPQGDVVTRALEIYETYCAPTAALAVNLPYGVLDKLRKTFGETRSDRKSLGAPRGAGPVQRKLSERTLNSLNADGAAAEVGRNTIDFKTIRWNIFDAAGKEIVNLMCSDTFRRFRVKPEYRDYVIEKYKMLKGRPVFPNSKIMSQLVEDDEE